MSISVRSEMAAENNLNNPRFFSTSFRDLCVVEKRLFTPHFLFTTLRAHFRAHVIGDKMSRPPTIIMAAVFTSVGSVI